MQIETSRFGTIEVTEKEIVAFPEGLLGFPNHKKYALLPMPENPYFYWLQSLTDKDLAFLLVDPFVFFPKYEVHLADEVLKFTKVTSPNQVAILTIVTIPHTGVKKATTNLVGPVVINLQELIGRQVVLQGTEYTTKHLLFAKANKKQKALHESR
ncbi:MAG: flagellar assembly protein FliW [Zhaonellaceae bacterium]